MLTGVRAMVSLCGGGAERGGSLRVIHPAEASRRVARAVTRRRWAMSGGGGPEPRGRPPPPAGTAGEASVQTRGRLPAKRAASAAGKSGRQGGGGTGRAAPAEKRPLQTGQKTGLRAQLRPSGTATARLWRRERPGRPWVRAVPRRLPFAGLSHPGSVSCPRL